MSDLHHPVWITRPMSELPDQNNSNNNNNNNNNINNKDTKLLVRPSPRDYRNIVWT